MKSRIESIHHIALAATNVTMLAAFYRETMLLEEIKPPVTTGSRWFRLGNAILMIEPADTAGDREEAEYAYKRPGWHAVLLRIEYRERDTWIGRLKKANVEIEQQSDYSIYFRDPEQNRIGLSWFKPGA